MVVASHLHFVIIPPTFDLAIFSSLTSIFTRLIVLVAFYHCTMPEFRNPFSQMFVEAVCMARCLILQKNKKPKKPKKPKIPILIV